MPDGEKNFEDTLIRFDKVHERDRRSDGQTPHDVIGHASIAPCGKNEQFYAV